MPDLDEMSDFVTGEADGPLRCGHVPEVSHMSLLSFVREVDAPDLPPGAGFAVIDVETTGLSPKTSRIVEIAVVLLDVDCRPVGEMTTLINPFAHISATDIHGIHARDVRHAPTFAGIAPLLFAGLRGRVPVAHNAGFELRMLSAEFNRIGVAFEGNSIPGLCTMSLASSYLANAPGRSLAACCEAANITLENAHTALGDAHATARLLTWYRDCHNELPPSWHDALIAAGHVRWPEQTDATARLLTREQAAYEDAVDVPYLARLVATLPRTTGVSAVAQTYLAALDRALADRVVTSAEASELGDLAHALSLGAEELLGVHRSYLVAVAGAALADGVITPAEMDDLREVARLLALGEDDLAAALAVDADADPVALPSGDELSRGDAVVITGETLMVSRAELEQRTRDAGLRLVSAVSRKTTVLVVADPHTQSGKARKAREVGTRIVGEAAYLQMLTALEGQPGVDGSVVVAPLQREPPSADLAVATVTPLRPRL
jgi:DNA polymerase-3 subunit epsilon